MYLITYLCVFVCVHMSIGTRGVGPWSWRFRQCASPRMSTENSSQALCRELVTADPPRPRN